MKDRLKKVFDIKKWGASLKKMGVFTWDNIIFLAVLFVYVVRGLLRWLLKVKLIGRIFKLIKTEWLNVKLTDLMYVIDKNEDGGVSRSYLIELAFRNMKAKRNRAIVTIGGVALGVGAIVLLVSIGYGLEKLVIGRVAKLDELKMADVTLGKASSVKLNDETVKKIGEIENVEEVIPVVLMVSKVKYKNSILDVMSFGVNEKYIKVVNPTFVAGEKFKDKDTDFVYVPNTENGVLGVSQEINWIDYTERPETGVFDFSMADNSRVLVLESCEMGAKPLGYMIRSEGGYLGEYVWGESYVESDSKVVFMDKKSRKQYSKWIRAKVPLWSLDSDNRIIPKLDTNGDQSWGIGCFKPDEVLVELQLDDRYKKWTLDSFLISGSVLGEATESAVLATDGETPEASTSADLFGSEVVTDASGMEWVEFKSTKEDVNKLKEVDFSGSIVGEAYISTAMLKLLNMSPDEALGKTFNVSYVVPDGNIKGMTGRLQSKEKEYKIKGVIEDNNTSFYYYHLADAKRLGISVYSQLKVLTDSQEKLSGVRKNIEFLGFKTDSTADTVVQIESLFKTLRLILGLLGTIALAVASLGMFNTMTVSLLERTREVGVMKAMGMLSNEVRELFLAESMIMGVGGGVFGILLGFSLGKILSLVLSSISLVKGQGVINIVYIPWFFTMFIMTISFVVGMVTGWYPSKRARQISALNALRYE
ncbi:MAG: ABC transporter permease [Candidatus Shapirobacteria bacterium]|nr:ABC transporter permease [Candidatus Shapirobacteria bacterium]